MTVINMQVYRHRKAINDLEKKIAEHALCPKAGSVTAIKFYFKELVNRQKTGT